LADTGDLCHCTELPSAFENPSAGAGPVANLEIPVIQIAAWIQPKVKGQRVVP
jgi:hypothetical protein